MFGPQRATGHRWLHPHARPATSAASSGCRAAGGLAGVRSCRLRLLYRTDRDATSVGRAKKARIATNRPRAAPGSDRKWPGTAPELFARAPGWLGTASERFGTASGWLGTASERFGTASEWLGTASERFGTASEWLGTASERFGTASQWLGTASQSFGRWSDHVRPAARRSSWCSWGRGCRAHRPRRGGGCGGGG